MTFEEKIRAAIQVHGRNVSRLAEAAQSSNMALIEAKTYAAKQARGECRHLLNNYLMLPKRDAALVDRLRELVTEIENALALLLAARNTADEPEARALLRELREIVEAAVGPSQRKAWWDAANQAVKRRQEATVTRRMEGGNAISLGTSGGLRQRRSL